MIREIERPRRHRTEQGLDMLSYAHLIHRGISDLQVELERIAVALESIAKMLAAQQPAGGGEFDETE